VKRKSVVLRGLLAISPPLICIQLSVGQLGCKHSEEPPPQSWDLMPTHLPRADWVRESHPLRQYRSPPSPSYAELIRAAVRAEGRTLRRCYRDMLKKDPSHYGTMTVRFVVQADGSARDAVVDFSTLPSPALEACVLEVFNRVTFPPAPQPEFTVRYPFVFTSDRTPEEVRDALVARYHLQAELDSADGGRKSRPKDNEAPW